MKQHARIAALGPSGSAPLVQPFYPALDGLRAIAFMMVFAVHYISKVWKSPIFDWGWTGVDLFFVLSGFLITGILYDSVHHPHFFRNFYTRRALRIFPLFFGFWLVLLALTPVIHIVWNRYNLAQALYVGNFFIPGSLAGLHANPGGIVYHAMRHPEELRSIDAQHLWSLCVEEQFYIAWPLAVWWLRSRKALLTLCACGILASLVFRLGAAHLWPFLISTRGLYSNTFSRADSLLVGAALALWIRGTTTSVTGRKRLGIGALCAGPAILAAFIAANGGLQDVPSRDTVVNTVGFTLIAFACAGILLLAISPGPWLRGILQARPLVLAGRLSYGLYFFHQILLPYFTSLVPEFSSYHVAFLMPIVGLAFTATFAWLSFRYLESPFLRLKHRFAPEYIGSLETVPPPSALRSLPPFRVAS